MPFTPSSPRKRSTSAAATTTPKAKKAMKATPKSKAKADKENAAPVPAECSSLTMVFVSDTDSEEIRDWSADKKRKDNGAGRPRGGGGSSQDEEEQDEALTMFGKYRCPVDRIRGDVKGSQVFGFKTPSAKTRAPLAAAAAATNTPTAAAPASSTTGPGRRSKPTRKTVNEKENADAYFEAHGDGEIATSDRTLGQLKTPRLDQADLDRLLENEPVRYETQINCLLDDYRGKFDKWLRLLNEDFNLVLFGLGSKKSILQEFHQKMLLDSHHSVVVNGFFPSLTIKQILNGVTEDVLEHDGTFASLPEQVDFIHSQLTAADPLYLIVHNIDGPILRSEKSQALLAQLASSPNVRLVCSIDHINAPLIWDQHKMSLFNFVWFDATTFLPYDEETRNENSFMVKQSGALALNSLKHVFASLAPNAKRVYLIVVEYQLECFADEGYQGISFHDLYKRCRDAFLVNSDLTLRAQLTEFKDHKLVLVKKGADGLDYLTIPLANATLEEFLEEQQGEQ